MKIQIPDFSKSKVLVVGDIMLDRYWHGATSRISPEAPVPVVNVSSVEERAGGAGNVALNIAALGGSVSVQAMVGVDEVAASLNNMLAAEGVDCQFIATEKCPTITKLRVVSRHQQLIRLDFEDGFAHANHDELIKIYSKALAACEVVVFSDYGKGTLQAVQELIRLARAADKTVLVDPKGSDFSRYQHASLITPNQQEFEAVVGPCIDTDEMAAKGQQLLNELDLAALLITRSEKGVLLLQRDAAPLALPTRAREVYDVTGAGDTVIAALAASLAAGVDISEATALANIAAGVVVGKLGTATSTVQELQSAMFDHEPLMRGIVDESELQRLMQSAKASGERVVMTNGCFDILHAGHVAYLSQARDLGDRLIVAVNDDDSVRQLKGADRPVNGLMQRMAVLAGLESVDWVLPFSEDTPARLIEQIVPDILVKGGDYDPDTIVGGDVVRQHGGEVVVMDFIDGCSTTEIINAIRKNI